MNDSAMDEGGTFVTKSCASSVYYYSRAADLVEQYMAKGLNGMPKEPALLHVEESDGLQGRRHAQYHGSSPTLIGGPIRQKDGRKAVLRRANGE